MLEVMKTRSRTEQLETAAWAVAEGWRLMAIGNAEEAEQMWQLAQDLADL